MEQPEGSPCFFSCFSSTTCLPDLTVTQEMKGRNSLYSMLFLSLLLPASFGFFLVFLFSFSFFSPSLGH
jgi:hypothetical protein